MNFFFKILCLFIITNSYAQKDSFNYFLKKNITKIDSLFSKKEKIVKTKIIADFNFLKMEVINDSINDNDFYKAHYNSNNEIIQLDKIKKGHYYHDNYSFFFKKINKSNTHIYLKFKCEDSLSGIIFFNSKKEHLFSIKIYNLFKKESPNVQINKNIGTSSINFMHTLDEHLNTITKSIFYDSHMITHSILEKRENIWVEKLHTYSDFSSKSADFESLKNITLGRLLVLLDIGSLNDNNYGVYLTAIPRQIENTPIVLMESNKYE